MKKSFGQKFSHWIVDRELQSLKCGSSTIEGANNQPIIPLMIHKSIYWLCFVDCGSYTIKANNPAAHANPWPSCFCLLSVYVSVFAFVFVLYGSSTMEASNDPPAHTNPWPSCFYLLSEFSHFCIWQLLQNSSLWSSFAKQTEVARMLSLSC